METAQGIGSQNIDVFLPKYSGFSTRMSHTFSGVDLFAVSFVNMHALDTKSTFYQYIGCLNTVVVQIQTFLRTYFEPWYRLFGKYISPFAHHPAHMKIKLRNLDDKSIFVDGNARKCDIHIIPET